MRPRSLLLILSGGVMAGLAAVVLFTGGSQSLMSQPATVPHTAGPSYYVDDRDGRDSNTGTSPDAPWRTLARAGEAPLAPGSRLHLRRDGKWSGPLVLTANGTAASPIVVAPYGDGERPLITGATTCVDVAGSHIVVSELEVRDCSWAGMAVAGSGNLLTENLVTGNAAGIYVRGGAMRNRVLRNELIDNDRMSVLTHSTREDDSGAFGVLLHGDSNEVAYNRISGSSAVSYDYGHDGAAVEIFGGRDNEVHHNMALENTAFTELGGSRTAGNVFTYNVVRSSVEDAVFLITRGGETTRGPVLRTSALHNTVLLTGAKSQGFVCHAGCGPDILTLRNNIIVAQWKAGYADRPFDEDADLFSGGPLRFQAGPRTLVADPGFIDAEAGDLRLRRSSPAVDHGEPAQGNTDLDGTPVPQDGDGDGVPLPDLGAYEVRGG